MKTTRELQPRERACANDHHNLLLENLLIKRNIPIINTPRKPKQSKETNWKHFCPPGNGGTEGGYFKNPKMKTSA